MKDQKQESTVLLKCKADKIQEFKSAVSKLVDKTVKEPGCEIFKIFQNNENPDEFILWEIFKDKESLDTHMDSEHTQECFALGLFEVVSATHHTEII